MDTTELQNDRTIDPGNLDVEVVRQADVFFKWAERSIEAKAHADALEFKLDVLEAKLQMRCRDDPDAFGVKNVTETAIKSAVLASDKYGAAYREWNKAKAAASLLSSAVSAMEQRKRMLELLVTLHGQQYFAGPSVPRDLVAEWQEHQKRTSDVSTERQAKRVRRRRES